MKKMIAFLLALSIIAAMPICGVKTADAAEISTNAEDATKMDQSSSPEKELNDSALWEKGGINSDGTKNKSTKVIRTRDYVSENIALVYAENDYVFTAAVYDTEEQFLGFWDGKNIAATSKSLYYLNPNGLEGTKIRLVCQRLGAGIQEVSESSNVHFLGENEAKQFAPQPTLTFIDDDGCFDALKNWESICDETGINITSALVTNTMGDENDDQRSHVSWGDVARLQEKGFEFISHTHNHIDIAKRTEAQCRAEFEASIAALREHGCEYRYLVYPYNSTNSDRIELVKQYFSAAVGLGGSSSDPGACNTLPLYTYWIRRYSINEPEATKKVEYNGQMVDAHAFRDIDTLKGYIDDAVTNNGWTIIMTHLRNDGMFYHDEESRQLIVELCEYAKEKGVVIQTFGEAFSRYENYAEMGNKSVYGDPHYIVDTNGVAHYRGMDENGHVADMLPEKQPTCGETGLTEGKICYICKEILQEQELVSATGAHIYDNDYDAVCNICGDIREITAEIIPDFVADENKITINAYGLTNVKAYTFSVGDSEISDINDWYALKAIDPNFKSYTKETFTISAKGNYVLRIQYTDAEGVIKAISYRIKIDTLIPAVVVTGNKVVVNTNDKTNVKVYAFNIGNNDVSDINDWYELKSTDPAFKTYTKGTFTLAQNSNYVLRVQYTDVSGIVKMVSYPVETDSSMPDVVVAGNKVAVNANGTSNVKVFAFAVENYDAVDINDWYALKTVDPAFKTYTKSSFSLVQNGNYVLRVQYADETGAINAVSYPVTIDSKTPDVAVAGKNVTMVANGLTVTKVHAFYVEGNTVSNINDWSALKKADPGFRSYTKGTFSLSRSGKYVLRVEYVDENGEQQKFSCQIDIL